MLKKILISAAITAIIIVSFLAYLGHQFSKSLQEMGDCGFSAGPIKNISISLNLDTVKIDQKLTINGGSLLLSNLKNDKDPQLIKTNNSGNIIWAIAFPEDSIDFPHKKLSEMELDTCFSGYCLSFFNNSFGEPGTIHLDSNYNFLYMCLKPF